MQLEFALARARQQFFPASWNGHSDRGTVLLMGARARATMHTEQ
jgi:hypothetical protein